MMDIDAINMHYRPETYIRDIMAGVVNGNHTVDEALDMMEEVLRQIGTTIQEG